MKKSPKILLLAIFFSAVLIGCKEKSINSMPKTSLNKKQIEKDLTNEKWLKVEELIKYGDIKDSADFMDKVNTIMGVHDHKRSSFRNQTSSVDANGSLHEEIRMVTSGTLKNVTEIRPGDKEYEAAMSNLPGDISTLNIKLLFEELAARRDHPSPLWRCINIYGGQLN